MVTGWRLAVLLACGPPSQPLSHSTAGTTTISPATRPRAAAPICWRYQRSSSLTVGWRQVDGIGIGSSSCCSVSCTAESGHAPGACGAACRTRAGIVGEREAVLEAGGDPALGLRGGHQRGQACQLRTSRGADAPAGLTLRYRCGQELSQFLGEICGSAAQIEGLVLSVAVGCSRLLLTASRVRISHHVSLVRFTVLETQRWAGRPSPRQPLPTLSRQPVWSPKGGAFPRQSFQKLIDRWNVAQIMAPGEVAASINRWRC